MPQQACKLELPGAPETQVQYLLYVPPIARVDEARTWPVILFLHGSGERGADLEQVRTRALPARVEQREDLPFIIVSPQCPERSGWQSQVRPVMQVLERVLSNTPADRSRVYLTGISMGGFGAWYIGCRYPNVFAAIAPICGFGPSSMGFPQRVASLRSVPVWAFHGGRDDVVPVVESERLVHALRDAGGNARVTVYPEAGHDAWTMTYEGAALYDWFLAHRKEPR